MVHFRYFILFLLFQFFSLYSNGQWSRPVRAEVDVAPRSESMNIVPVSDKGVIIFYNTKEYKTKRMSEWDFSSFDALLQKSWTQKILIPDDFEFVDYELIGDSVFFLTQAPKLKNEENLLILGVNTFDGGISKRTFTLKEKAEVEAFKFELNSMFWIASNSDGLWLYKYDIQTGILDEIEIYKGEDVDFHSIDFDPESIEVALIFSVKINRKSDQFYLVEYDLSTKEVLKIPLNTDPDKKLLTSEINFVGKNKVLIVGSYNFMDEKSVYVDKGDGKESAGFYSFAVDKGKVKVHKTYNYLELKNLVRLMGRNNADKRRDNDRKVMNPKETSLNYLLIPHALTKLDSTYVFIAEAYYPEYRTVSEMSYDVYGRMVPYTRTIFEGFRYTDAICAAFDKNGNIVKDYVFDVWNILSTSLVNRVHLLPDSIAPVVAYHEDGKLVYKTLQSSQSQESAEEVKIETAYPNDKVISTYGANMKYWFGNNYLVFGYQTIRNNSIPNRSKREVFFMNRIIYR